MATGWEIKRRLYKAINAHDLPRVLDQYSPDGVLVGPWGVAEGHDQIAWVYEQFFKGFPDYHKTAWKEVDDLDNPSITEYTITGTHLGPLLLPNGCELPGTGRPVVVRASCACYADNDRIVTHREYYDQLELYSQLGLCLADTCNPPSPVAGSGDGRVVSG